MALADVYKQNNVTYYESGYGMSGVFSDTIDNLTADSMIDYSIFLNTGSTWTMKNTGTIGNHFAWYADWVGGVLAVRKGPDVVSINYLGSAILSKNTSCVVANLSAKKADGAGWANFKNARFMIDAIQFTQGSASQYVAFDYAGYSGQKYGFNSCFIQSTAGYATSNTAHNYTGINDYTALTGDNAKRIVYSNYQVMLTSYNPYLADSTDIGKYNVGYIWDFFNIGGEIVCVRDILRMPNSAHWQSWAHYTNVTDEYVTIGGFGDNVTAGSQGALPLSDDVKGIYSYNNSGTSANWFSTKNAVDYKTNSMGLRWCVGNNTISTAKQWRDNVRLGVMRSDGVIKHNEWIIGESAIQASDNPNKDTDYDHIPAHGGGGGGDDDDSDWDDIPINGAGIGGGSAFCRFYYCTENELASLRTWTMGLSQGGDPIPAGFDPKSNIIGLTVFPFTISGNGPTTIKFVTNGGIDPITQQEMPRSVDSGVSCEGGAGNTVRILNATIDVPATMKDLGEPWLDYESYIELYIPMCGIYQVDPQVCIGRTIHVEIFLDPISGTVMGIAWVDKGAGKCIIAQGSGTPGVQIPVAVGNYGLAQAARVQNTLAGFGNTATSAISTTMVSNTFQNRAGERGLNGVRKISQNATAGSKIAAFNRSGGAENGVSGAALGFAGILSSVQHWVSARQIANSPGTSASGGFSGSMAEWCGVFTPYVKIVRPKFRKPDNYKHTCGEPEVTTRKLNSVGYAVCINPDVSGLTNATEAERAAVYQFLSTGVYYK